MPNKKRGIDGYLNWWAIVFLCFLIISTILLIKPTSAYDSRIDGRPLCNYSNTLVVTRHSSYSNGFTNVTLDFIVKPVILDLFLVEAYNGSAPFNISCNGRVERMNSQIRINLNRYQGGSNFSCSYLLKWYVDDFRGYAQYRKSDDRLMSLKFCDVVNTKTNILIPTTTSTSTTSTTTFLITTTTTTTTTILISTTTTTTLFYVSEEVNNPLMNPLFGCFIIFALLFLTFLVLLSCEKKDKEAKEKKDV